MLPIQYIVDGPVKTIDWLVASFTSNQNMQKSNTDMKVELLLLRAQLQKLIAVEKENAQLRAMLQTYPRSSERLLVAQLLSVNSDAFLHEVVINQGSKAGLYVGQPVLDATGVLGQVMSVGLYTSRVLLLTDTRSALPSQDTRSGVRGIVVGTGDMTTVELSNIPETANVKQGDLLVTSGLDGHFPSGYPIGTVAKVVNNPGQEFSDITIVPSSEINRSRLVLLVWPDNTLARADNMALKTLPLPNISKSAALIKENRTRVH